MSEKRKREDGEPKDGAVQYWKAQRSYVEELKYLRKVGANLWEVCRPVCIAFAY